MRFACVIIAIFSPPLRPRAALTASCWFFLELHGSRGSPRTVISARRLVSFTANSSGPESASFHNQTYINDLLKYYFMSAPSLAFAWRPIIKQLNLIKRERTPNEENCTVIWIPGETVAEQTKCDGQQSSHEYRLKTLTVFACVVVFEGVRRQTQRLFAVLSSNSKLVPHPRSVIIQQLF